jgi:hypothetical protein
MLHVSLSRVLLVHCIRQHDRFNLTETAFIGKSDFFFLFVRVELNNHGEVFSSFGLILCLLWTLIGDKLSLILLCVLYFFLIGFLNFVDRSFFDFNCNFFHHFSELFKKFLDLSLHNLVKWLIFEKVNIVPKNVCGLKQVFTTLRCKAKQSRLVVEFNLSLNCFVSECAVRLGLAADKSSLHVTEYPSFGLGLFLLTFV